MICYRDRTFCGFYKKCSKGQDCSGALTDEVKEGAKKWMGENAPICRYTNKPNCFKEKK